MHGTNGLEGAPGSNKCDLLTIKVKCASCGEVLSRYATASTVKKVFWAEGIAELGHSSPTTWAFHSTSAFLMSFLMIIGPTLSPQHLLCSLWEPSHNGNLALQFTRTHDRNATQHSTRRYESIVCMTAKRAQSRRIARTSNRTLPSNSEC